MKKTILRIILPTLAVLLLLAAIFGYRLYQDVFHANVDLKEEARYIYIGSGADFERVSDTLAPWLEDQASFTWVARKKSYIKMVKPGRYKIQDGWSNNELVNHLRAGNQAPLNVIINNIRYPEELAGVLGSKLEPDSLDFWQYYSSAEVLDKFELSPRTLLANIIPNTYQFYWNTDPEKALVRLLDEADKFWAQRQGRLRELDMDRREVATLASIVESETVQKDEMPRVAGLYINRLERGMRLESDPTVIYGIEKAKPGLDIKRVLYKHLRYDSPYNTYLHKGLPPGPILLPSIAAIDAVLNYEDHSYIFMAADPERPGYHNFARSLRQHNIYARKYINWLNQQ